MSTETTNKSSGWREDPVYLHCRREAILILALWSVCLLYTCTYCYLNGYSSHETNAKATGPSLGELVGPLPSWDRDPESLQTPLGLGIPDWIFYGVVLPWLVCLVFSLWYGLFFFAEDDLSDAEEALEE